jgi:hypothetical protein
MTAVYASNVEIIPTNNTATTNFMKMKAVCTLLNDNEP